MGAVPASAALDGDVSDGAVTSVERWDANRVKTGAGRSPTRSCASPKTPSSVRPSAAAAISTTTSPQTLTAPTTAGGVPASALEEDAPAPGPRDSWRDGASIIPRRRGNPVQKPPPNASRTVASVPVPSRRDDRPARGAPHTARQAASRGNWPKSEQNRLCRAKRGRKSPIFTLPEAKSGLQRAIFVPKCPKSAGLTPSALASRPTDAAASRSKSSPTATTSPANVSAKSSHASRTAAPSASPTRAQNRTHVHLPVVPNPKAHLRDDGSIHKGLSPIDARRLDRRLRSCSLPPLRPTDSR